MASFLRCLNDIEPAFSKTAHNKLNCFSWCIARNTGILPGVFVSVSQERLRSQSCEVETSLWPCSININSVF